MFACFFAKDKRERDYKKGFKLLKSNAKRIIEEDEFSDYVSENITLIDFLGWAYERGYGVKRNEKQAIKYTEYCADQGLGEDIYRLGILYLRAKDKTLRNKDYAETYLYQAGQCYTCNAFYCLAYYFETGKYLGVDLEKAKFYYACVLENEEKEETYYKNAVIRLKNLDNNFYEKVMSSIEDGRQIGPYIRYNENDNNC